MKVIHLVSGGNLGGIESLCVDIGRLSKHDNHFCFLFSGGATLDYMLNNHYQVSDFSADSFLKKVRKLKQLVKLERPDAVVVHNEGTGIYLCYVILALFYPRAKYIKYLHMSYEEKYMFRQGRLANWMHKKTLKAAFHHSSRCIAVSEYVRDSYVKSGFCRKEKIEVIYNGVEISKELPTRQIVGDTIKLLYIGRVVPEKGVDILIKAVLALAEQGRNIQLTIVGDGELRTSCEQIVENSEYKNVICFEGYQNDKTRYYKDFDYFVYPSVWQEAFGISIIEAMSYGMICIASKVGGIPEIIRDKVNGFLVTAGDVTALMEKIQEMELLSEVERESMIKESRETAEEFFIVKMVVNFDRMVVQYYAESDV